MTTEQVCEWDESDEPRIYEPGIIHFDDDINTAVRYNLLRNICGNLQSIGTLVGFEISHADGTERAEIPVLCGSIGGQHCIAAADKGIGKLHRKSVVPLSDLVMSH